MFTNFSHGVASMGIPALGSGIPPTNGRYIFVDYVYGADGNDGLSLDTPVKTFAQANSLTKNNDDDVIVLDTRATHVITSMVTISNSRVNVVSMDFSGRRYGLSAKISMPTGTATDTAMITNLGSRNSFTGVKFSCDNARANMMRCF